MPPKRSRVSTRRAFKTASRTGTGRYVASARMMRSRYKFNKANRALAGVARLTRMIETKQTQWASANNIAIAHNNLILINKDDGGPLNPFQSIQGVGDPMTINSGQRIGDRLSLKGMLVKGFFEGALNRSKVHFRVMLLRGAKGETFSRANCFQGKSDNKMLDMLNTDRFTCVWQKSFTVSPPNAAPQTVNVAGETLDARIGITGNRIIKAWIPGHKFGRDGNIQYEDSSANQVKFYDYRFMVLAYDWYGTPQDANTVGRVNEMYSLLYYKDA